MLPAFLNIIDNNTDFKKKSICKEMLSKKISDATVAAQVRV